MAKPKLSGLQQAHGKDETSKVNEINEILGERDELRKFKSEDSYLKYINALDKADLQVHAIEVAIFPTDSRTILIERLVRNFAEKKVKFRQSSRQPQTAQERYSSSQIKKIEKAFAGK